MNGRHSVLVAPRVSRALDESAMAAAIEALDWAATPLGPASGWPQSLRATVRLLLGSRYPMFVWWGPRFIQIYNDAYAVVLGARHPAALGRSGADVWTDVWDVVGPQAERVLQEGVATWNDRVQLVMHRHGFVEETYFTFSYSPAFDDAGAVGGVFCTCTDDTLSVLGDRRLQSLRALAGATVDARGVEEACRRAARSLAGNALDLPFLLIYRVHGDGTVRLVDEAGPARGTVCAPAAIDLADPDAVWPFAAMGDSRSMRDIHGLAGRCPVVGSAWPEPVDTCVVLPLAAPNQAAIAGYLVAGISPRRPLDDDYRDYLLLAAQQIASAMADADAFEAQRDRVASLAELDRAKTAFFSNVSHELRTPLTLMLGPLDDLVDRPGRPPEEREALALARRNGRRLHRLVNALLDFSRLEAGRLEAHYEPVDLAGFTAELASVFRAAAERAGLALEVDCPTLPQPVYVDRPMWEKIVFNLLSNALKFTFEGTIRVRLEAEPGGVRLEVADTGIGVPDDAKPRLFERFFRVPGAHGRSIEGSGIGLALVAELVRLHGGSVAVHDRESAGSAFEVRLPYGPAHLPAHQVGVDDHSLPGAAGLASDAFLDETQALLLTGSAEPAAAWPPADVPAAAAPASSTAEAPARPPEARAEVLIVDDNDDMRAYLMRLIGREHAVRGAADGLQALQSVQERAPDLVLSDVTMPRLDGFGLLRALRNDPATAGLPMMLLSAHAGESARLQGLQAGADDYLLKPFQARELLARVSGVLALARVRREAMRREQALREELENVLESITEGFLAFDASWRFTYANSAAERIVAMTRDQLLGRNVYEAFPGLRGTPFEAVYQRAMAERVPLQVDAPYEPLGGWFEVNVYPVSSGGLALYFRDVRESRLMEQALRASEAQQRFLAEFTVVLQELEDPDEVPGFAVQKLCEHLGADRALYIMVDEDAQRAEVSGSHARGGVVPLVGHWPLGEFGGEPAAHYRRGQAFVVEDSETDPRLDAKRSAFRAVDIRANLSVGVMHHGRLVAAIAVHQRAPRHWTEAEVGLVQAVAAHSWEALERTRTQRLQQQSERRFRDLAESMPQIVYVSRQDGSTEYLNRRWNDFTGQPYDGPESMGAVVHPDDIAPTLGAWQRSLATGDPFVAELRMRGTDGVFRWFLTRAVRMQEGDSGSERWYGTSTDIDAQKRDAEALARAHSALQQADRRKDQFLATLAHELRNPLAPLRNGIQLLRTTDPAATGRVREMMGRQIDHMVRLVDDLLEVSRITSGKVTLKRRSVALGEILASATETSRPLIDAGGHRLQLDGMEAAAAHVNGDPVRLAQVFANLLNNAAKYTPRPGHIRLGVGRAGSDLMVSVRDDGIGIAPEMQAEIFEPFVQLDRSSARSQGGLGIGLSLVKSLVELHGGRVEVRSDGPGRGSEFLVHLPADDATGRSEAGAAPRALPAPGHLRILVVDDNRDAADSLAGVLEMLGATVDVAYDGLEALARQESGGARLVLLDLGMPDIDGFEVARRLRRQPGGPALHLVALSGWGQPEDRQRAREAGFDEHLVKPVDLNDLDALLARVGAT